MTVRADAVEAVLDALVPLLPRGVHERDLGDGRAELAFHEHRDALPPRATLEAAAGAALLGWAEEEVPDDPRERRRRYGRGWTVAGRLRVRGPDDAPGDGALPELVIEAGGGAFGTGAHPTTRMCLELLLDLEPAGGFADLGCGAGVLAIAAAAARLVAGARARPRAAERRRDAPQRRAQRGGGRGAARPTCCRSRRRRCRRWPPTSRRALHAVARLPAPARH